ncbi:MAG: DUF308 domain-containing protein [Actinobacteria bacterium]|nr:DUF308 domain-containing protein [Actinomycetota bacterium]
MNTATTPIATPVKGARLALLIGGLAAVGFGIAVLAWPTKAAVALTGVIAVYAIISGIVYAALGIFSKALGAGGRIGHVLLGLLYVIAGVYAFSSLQQSAAFLALFLTIMVGVMWVIEGFTALFTLGQSGSKIATIIFAILSVIAGFSLLSSPLWGAVFLWWFLGIALIVLGALNVIRAITGKKA